MFRLVFQSTITALQLNTAAGTSLNPKQGQELQNYPGRNADAKSSLFLHQEATQPLPQQALRPPSRASTSNT